MVQEDEMEFQEVVVEEPTMNPRDPVVSSPSTCPTMTRPSSPPTAARAVLSLAYWTKAKPLCTEQPTILPYLEKMASTSALAISSVLRLPMKTRELSERWSVLLVTLLAIWAAVVGDHLVMGGGRVGEGEGGGGRDEERGHTKEQGRGGGDRREMGVSKGWIDDRQVDGGTDRQTERQTDR